MADNHSVHSVFTPIQVDLSTPKKKKKKNVDVVFDCLDDDEVWLVNDDDDYTPLRPVFCLNKKSAIKEFEMKEDCFILDFNPEDDPAQFSVQSVRQNNPGDSPDVSIIAEKGQVACRDYPHSRHVCAKYPFKKTPHESYCGLCYCYVCDIAAPCKSWSGAPGHCHAIDNEGWRHVRKLAKKGKNP